MAVWEKARGAGGRFATSRAPSNPSCTVDLGAQAGFPQPHQHETLIFAVSLAIPRGGRWLPVPGSSLSWTAPACRPQPGSDISLSFSVLCIASTCYWTSRQVKGHRHGDGGDHFVAPQGASSLVKHFLKQSNADTTFGRRVAEVSILLAKKFLSFAFKILATEDGRWRVKSECGQEAEFDAVIVATTFFGCLLGQQLV